MDGNRKLLVLGNSNEISQKVGYIRSIQDRLIINASVGGCSSLAGIPMLGLNDIPKGGYCLLNYELNENGILRDKLRSETEIKEIWQYLISKAFENNATPIILILPYLHPNGSLFRSLTADVYVAIAREACIPFLDIARFFVNFVESGVSPCDLMKDNAHLSPWGHNIVAKIVSECLVMLDGFERSTRMHEAFRPNYFMIWAKDMGVGKLIYNKSSLSEGEFAEITQQDVLNIQLPEPGYELIGLSLNRKSLGGALNTHGLCKHLTYEQAGLPGFMRVVTDIKALPVQDRSMSFSFTPTNASPPTEATWLTGRVSENAECSLELECIIFRSPHSAPINLKHEFPLLDDFDLLELLPKSMLLEACQKTSDCYL